IDLHPVEEVQATEPGAGAAQFGGIEGIALGQPEFAPHDLVEGADIADDIDPLNEYARALANGIGDVDNPLFTVAGDIRAHVDERIAHPAESRRDRLHRVFDLVGIVDVVGFGGDQRLQLGPVHSLDLADYVHRSEAIAVTLLD